MSDGPLSQHEQTVLWSLEHALREDDPAFVIQFDLDAHGLDRPDGEGWLRAVARWLRHRPGQT